MSRQAASSWVVTGVFPSLSPMDILFCRQGVVWTALFLYSVYFGLDMVSLWYVMMQSSICFGFSSLFWWVCWFLPCRWWLVSDTWWPGTHFTNNFSITIQIQWKIYSARIQLLVIISQQNLAHATTAQLSCHVPNFVAITLLVLGWEQNEISITFELWWKNCEWNGPQLPYHFHLCVLQVEITHVGSDSALR